MSAKDAFRKALQAIKIILIIYLFHKEYMR